jgi:hypothetical protein
MQAQPSSVLPELPQELLAAGYVAMEILVKDLTVQNTPYFYNKRLSTPAWETIDQFMVTRVVYNDAKSQPVVAYNYKIVRSAFNIGSNAIIGGASQIVDTPSGTTKIIVAGKPAPAATTAAAANPGMFSRIFGKGGKTRRRKNRSRR